MYENKKIFILGMARSGYECAKLLSSKGCEITVVDMKEQDQDQVTELESLGVKVIITENQTELLDNTFDYVIKNPGIKLDNPVVLKANELGIKIVNEYDVAYSFLKDREIIAITGSNGKTTTTTLIYEFLKEHGCKVHIGGNMGFPLCKYVEITDPGDILVIETAGHQLIHCYDYKPNVAVMTNLYQVHIDHFGTFENYKNAKARVFQAQDENDIAIYNAGNVDVVDKVKDIKAKKISFTAKDDIQSDLYLKNDAIYYNDEKIIDTKDIKLQGKHNYENIMCAIAATRKYGVTNQDIFNVLNRFNGVEHRMEFVKTVKGVDYYNDSKATNVESTQIALSSFNKPTILILGGLDRGHSFEPLTPYLKNTKLIVCYGETKNRIKEFADSLNIECIVLDNLIEAIHCCYEHAISGDVVILSPACASWDQYKKFEDRGDEFKNTVKSLGE